VLASEKINKQFSKKSLIITEHLTWTGRRITLNDDTNEDKDDRNQLTSDVNS